MNKQRRRRLYAILFLLAAMGLAAGLVLYALKQNINLFLTPTQALAHPPPAHHNFRLGGQVKPGSLSRDKKNLTVYFVLTDLQSELPVHYSGILPDLFREGTGAIADGTWDNQGGFVATQILAKHDEKYVPKFMK